MMRTRLLLARPMKMTRVSLFALLLIVLSGCRTVQMPAPPVEPVPVRPPVILGVDQTEWSIVEAAEARSDAAIALLEEIVRIPSATSNHEGVRAVGRVLARELETLGFETRWLDAPPELNRAGHLVAERSGSTGRRLLLIGHLDTVIDGDWFERDGDLARASGGSDMKGGLVIMIEALRAMHSAGTLDDHQIIVFLTGDEEEGGRPLELARAPLVEAAQRSDVALAFEGGSGGHVTVGRRGTEQWIIEIEARTGHSSGIFRNAIGYGASYEAARILDAFREAFAGQRYVSLNPAVVLSGSDTRYDAAAHHGSTGGVTNIVADRAVIEGDMRFLTPEQRRDVMETMERIVTTNNLPHATSTIRWNEGYPSMPPTEGNYLLASILDGVSRDLGMEPITPGNPGWGGAGDVSFVAGYVDAIDSLGAMGGRAHTIDEVVRLDTLAELAARAAVLMHRLTDPQRLAETRL
jgi:glutamate carboxypeptidase